jgi:hypothetical protein
MVKTKRVPSKVRHPRLAALERKRSEGELAAELQNTGRQGTRNLTKRSGASIACVWIVPVRPMEDVKRIRLELHPHAFAEGQTKALPQG